MGEAVALGVGIGLGVGLPVSLTILVLAYVSVKHRQRAREEDLRHANIDVNVDDSVQFPGDAEATFGSTDSYEKLYDPTRDFSPFGHPAMPPSVHERAATMRSTRTEPDMLYTPSFDVGNVSQADLSRSLHSLYGAAPAYASTERLRAPSLFDNASIHTAGSNPYQGPFATPPRAHVRTFENSALGHLSLQSGSTDTDATSVDEKAARVTARVLTSDSTDVEGDAKLSGAAKAAVSSDNLPQAAGQGSNATLHGDANMDDSSPEVPYTRAPEP